MADSIHVVLEAIIVGQLLFATVGILAVLWAWAISKASASLKFSRAFIAWALSPQGNAELRRRGIIRSTEAEHAAD